MALLRASVMITAVWERFGGGGGCAEMWLPI